jgi:hypothetical protein
VSIDRVRQRPPRDTGETLVVSLEEEVLRERDKLKIE